MLGETVLGKYTVSKHIGGGGMAQVYLAEGVGDSNRVAVKIMNTEHVSRSRSLERFRREGRLLCKLEHPNLVRGIEAGNHNGRPAIVMEFIEGPSIEALILKRGHLSVKESLKLLLDIAAGLNHLHIHGHIQAHRDIKPTNVLVDSSGAAKITDFGISKAVSDAESMTLTSSFLGSPHYMAPEQIIDPRAADVRTDLYALGAVLYEMLTGEKAYPGNSTKEILDAHFELEPPTLDGDSPEIELANNVLLRTLSEKPEDRYQTPMELIEEVAPAIGAEVSISVPRFARSTVRFAALLAALSLITATVVGFVVVANTGAGDSSSGGAAGDASPAAAVSAAVETTAQGSPVEAPSSRITPERSSGSVNVGGTSGSGASAADTAKRALGGD